MFSAKKKTLYVVDIFGEIEASPKSLFSNKSTDMQKVIEALHKIEEEGKDKVAGVLIHLNTPGGTTGTSEEVATMIKKVRAKDIPVVASIADICCSGGYWIASACDHIFANRTSMTGSIGVIMMIPNYAGLSEKIGVKQVTVKSGKMKDIGNPFRELTDEEQHFLESHAAETHKLFIREVKNNRWHANIEEEAGLFDGRPYSAEFALAHGLIDNIGTYYDAMDYLLGMADMEEHEVEIKKAVKKKGFASSLFSAEVGDVIVSTVQSLMAGGNNVAMK